MKGNQFYGVNFPFADSDWNESEFDLNLEEEIASNIIYKLINTYNSD